MSDWQSIETAPKDGTCILIFGRCWADGLDWIANPFIGRWNIVLNRLEIENACGWYAANGPTHWMPLPEPPKE